VTARERRSEGATHGRPIGLAHQFWRAFNERELSQLDELIAPDYISHAALPGTPPGPAGQARVIERLWQAIPDARFVVDHVAFDSESATILCVGTMVGTHRGQLMGVAATGNRVRWRQCHLIRIGHDGRAVEHAAIRDDLGLMRQLGAGRETNP
jgi:predicted ester cyclase